MNKKSIDRMFAEQEKEHRARERFEAKFAKLAEQLENEYEGSAFVEYDSHSEGLCLKLWGIESIEKAREILKLYEKLQPWHLCRK